MIHVPFKIIFCQSFLYKILPFFAAKKKKKMFAAKHFELWVRQKSNHQNIAAYTFFYYIRTSNFQLRLSVPIFNQVLRLRLFLPCSCVDKYRF